MCDRYLNFLFFVFVLSISIELFPVEIEFEFSIIFLKVLILFENFQKVYLIFCGNCTKFFYFQLKNALYFCSVFDISISNFTWNLNNYKIFKIKLLFSTEGCIICLIDIWIFLNLFEIWTISKYSKFWNANCIFNFLRKIYEFFISIERCVVFLAVLVFSNFISNLNNFKILKILKFKLCIWFCVNCKIFSFSIEIVGNTNSFRFNFFSWKCLNF